MTSSSERSQDSLPKETVLADIKIAVTLAEHAVGLLTAITREAPRLDLGPKIAGINRQILALQGELVAKERRL